jgi:S-adenosyl methyltransferase
VRANRAFLARVVRYLAGEAGIRQFLDIGTGIPTANNTHEVAQAVAPASRVVYVDNDPVVLAHARALLTSGPEGATAYVDADFRDVDKILEEASQTLDFSRPVAIMLIAILHLIDNAAGPHEIVAKLMAAVPPGSYLAISTCPRISRRRREPRQPSGSGSSCTRSRRCAAAKKSPRSSPGWTWSSPG